MMTFEEYMNKIHSLEQEMKESKQNEGMAKVSAQNDFYRECERINAAKAAAMENAHMELNRRFTEIHEKGVEQRNIIWEQIVKVKCEWKEQLGIAPPHKCRRAA